MSTTVAGVVKNGVVVPKVPLPEGVQVEIHMNEVEVPPDQKGDLVEARVVPESRLTPAELRKLPREKWQTILAAAAELAEEDYRSDKELTGFEAFSEEELDDDESDSR